MLGEWGWKRCTMQPTLAVQYDVFVLGWNLEPWKPAQLLMDLMTSSKKRFTFSEGRLKPMEKARRPQVPAFGEWNYCYHHYAEPPAAECYYAPEPEPEACSDVWFRYSPPSKPTPRKTRRPESDAREKGSRRSARGSEAAGLAHATAKGRGASASRVVRPVDEDLYQVPPPEFVSSHRPRRKRNLLMGCLGLNSCVA
ncbi:uncharacterized protein LOC124708803 [Lolium rigidum]|uniref:uncharacterized protein LOC124708803 n=1 Tax=Lolium rigidum TaxID=89674 RepID=UPI001F5D76F2|nr:uncharacterized protein LOC124708803 [Lolium rigidum]